jgi:hypothetical protein
LGVESVSEARGIDLEGGRGREVRKESWEERHIHVVFRRVTKVSWKKKNVKTHRSVEEEGDLLWVPTEDAMITLSFLRSWFGLTSSTPVALLSQDLDW